ncbi:MAG: hypothetical protein WC775_05040 [Patescibacteria group bacterium]|jgi:hypothetical protein
MNLIEQKLYRLSPNQLKALKTLASSEEGIVASITSGKTIKVEGKALGGVFSSLSRQIINGEHLVLPWGKAEGGRGLRWRLNEKLISRQDLLQIVVELVRTY